jgi:hypothetical protein
MTAEFGFLLPLSWDSPKIPVSIYIDIQPILGYHIRLSESSSAHGTIILRLRGNRRVRHEGAPLTGCRGAFEVSQTLCME